MKAIKLKDGDHVFAAGWDKFPYLEATAVVGTARGLARKYGNNEDEYHALCIEREHDTAYTMFGGTCLVDDRALANRMAEERKANRAAAVELSDGDTVEIEGELFMVSIKGRNLRQPYNSNPIGFIRQQP